MMATRLRRTRLHRLLLPLALGLAWLLGGGDGDSPPPEPLRVLPLPAVPEVVDLGPSH